MVYLTFQKVLTASLANPAARTTVARLTLPAPEIAAGVFFNARRATRRAWRGRIIFVEDRK